MGRNHRLAPSLPLVPYRGLGLTVPTRLIWAGAEEAQPTPAKFPWLLGLPAQTSGSRVTTPSRPDQPHPSRARPGRAHSPSALLAGRGSPGLLSRVRHTRAPRPRLGPVRAGPTRLRGDSGGGGWDCVSRAHPALLALALASAWSSLLTRAKLVPSAPWAPSGEKVPAARGASAGAECVRESDERGRRCTTSKVPLFSHPTPKPRSWQFLFQRFHV